MMKHIISFSGGKDSTAMLLRMIELNYPIDILIFADTTLEFPEMYDWIDKIESLIKHKIVKVKCKHTFDDWFYGVPKRGKAGERGLIRGFPLTAYPCWWSRDGKVKPMEKEYGTGNTIYIGIALDEKKRADAKRYKKGDNIYKFPLIDWSWTEKDCIKYLEQRGLNHPLNGKFKRTGCWLCPKQSKESLKNLYIHYPDLWKKLKKYEEDSPFGFKPNFTLDDFEEQIKKELEVVAG